MDFTSPAASSDVRLFSRELSEKYGIFVARLGVSISGQPIEYLRFGCGTPTHLFVGTHHGSEHITSLILLRFVLDCCDAISTGKRLCGFDARYIFSHRTVIVVPMLNPDGADLSIGAFPQSEPVFQRLVRMNPAGTDFIHWQANARGVDLNHNYAADFEKCRRLENELGIFSGGPTRYGGKHPESEPETAALCMLTRLLSDRLGTVIALHTQGEEIYYGFGDKIPPGAEMLARCFAEVSGYRLSSPEGIASCGGYKDWVTEELGIPAFTIECGRGKNPLPPENFYGIYEKVLPILLTACAFR